MKPITIKNAYLHNLRHIDISIPKQQIVVITGVSGSGKSSLIFDLIFEEGRKKYLQSIGMAIDFGTPQYSHIDGLSPTVAVKQNIIRQSNPRSTVGSKTGLLNQFGLLYAHVGIDANETLMSTEKDPSLFSYLSPNGMCLECGGSGKTYHLHLDQIVIPESSAYLIFKQLGATKGYLNLLERKYPDDIHQPFMNLSKEMQSLLIYGQVDPQTGKHSYCIERILYNRLKKGEDVSEFYVLETCDACHGDRVGEEARSMTVNQLHIGDVSRMPLSQVKVFVETLLNDHQLSPFGEEISCSILKTLDALILIRLGHLTLYREIPTLSGGELQRLFLHQHLTSKLDALIYVFDEPTSGLHESEKDAIKHALVTIKEQGNSVLVVSHDRSIMQLADHLIDLGPYAGSLGGQIIYQGSYAEFLENKNSVTATYLSKDLTTLMTHQISQKPQYIELRHANLHNLKDVTVRFPLKQLVGIAGVSGSGKSSLVMKTLVNQVKAALMNPNKINHDIDGVNQIEAIVELSQIPIGRKENSNPMTYLGLWDKIRKLFANQQEAIKQKLTEGDFSFNSTGACQACHGSGVTSISIGFDIQFDQTCSVCHGTRFNRQTLSVTYKGLNINEVLDMSVSDAILFLRDSKLNLAPFTMLETIGMGYLKLGQPTSTLSGGEAQRIKLVKELSKSRKNKTLYVLDEPSIGLSQYDLSKLLYLFNELIIQGHSIIVVEHDLDILSCCDWIIELGIGSGDQGGNIIATGCPSDLRNNKASITGRYL